MPPAHVRWGEHNLRREIASLCAHLYATGQNAPGDGNVSVRLSERYLLCTPTRRHKGRLGPADIVKVRLADLMGVDGMPSSEIKLHKAIYETRPDVHAIVHAHSPTTVALTVAGESMRNPVVPEAIQNLSRIPTVPYESPTTADVASAVVPFAIQYDAFVLERHGPVALGKTLDEAASRLEITEHTARITQKALSIGSAAPISKEEADRLRKMTTAASETMEDVLTERALRVLRTRMR